nr:MAG TPA: hypothetical protein [Caudoviricetes sp.]
MATNNYYFQHQRFPADKYIISFWETSFKRI